MSETNKLAVDEELYKFLKDVKKEKPEVYPDLKRVLGYLYRTVKSDYYIEQRNYYASSSNYKNGMTYLNNLISHLFSRYVECDYGILYNLRDMIYDSDDRFLNKFFSGIETFLEMSEEHIYSSFDIYKYVFNIYGMLKAYRYNKNNYRNFCAVVDDLSDLFISSTIKAPDPSYSSNMGPARPHFYHKKDIIDGFVKSDSYVDTPYFRENLKRVFDEINYEYEFAYIAGYRQMFELYDKIDEAIADFHRRDLSIPEEKISSMKEYLFNSLTASVVRTYNKEGYRGVDNDVVCYFGLGLLYGNRHQYVMENLDSIEKSAKLKKDIFGYFEKFDYRLFDTLNEGMQSENDSFISCMKSVFDSDTYFELKSKLDSLVEASEKYATDRAEALRIVASLNSNKHKEVFDGIILTWPDSNKMNIIEKPKSIFERTMALYRKTGYVSSTSDYEYAIDNRYRNVALSSVVHDFKTMLIKAKEKKEESEKKAQEAVTPEVSINLEEVKKPKGIGSIFGRKK